jgi:hypothetical protein
MGAVNLNKFIGEAPKLSAELLPQNAAQIASNVKLYSGDLLPFNQSSLQMLMAKAGIIKTTYPLDDGVGGFKWLHWTTDVDVAKAPVPNNYAGGANDQRIYYTGDATGNGEPKSSTYSLATTYISGTVGAYPYKYYTLGLPAPTSSLSAGAITPLSAGMPVPFATITTATTNHISTITGGTGSTVTVTTAGGSGHGLNTGAYVTVAGITVNTSYNVVNAQITVTGTYTFTYFANGTGPGTATPTITAATIDLTGLQLARTYVYTLMTQWGEESAPSDPSATVYLYEGQTVNITNLLAALPSTGSFAGNVYQTTNMTLNIYRTVTSTTGTTYFKAGQVNLGTTTFTDNTPLSSLTVSLPSATWFQAPSNLQGIRAIHNNMLMGFFGTTVCFSEPGQPHAWPVKYYQEIGRTVVGLGTVGTTIIVLTDSNPWIIQGNTPSAMQKVRLDTNMPCTSKRGVVNMDWGLCFPTRGGIAVFSAMNGASLATSYVYDWDNFRTSVDPTTITAARYNNKYMASHSAGVFIFEKDDKTGGFLTETTQQFTAIYYNANTAQLYFNFGNPSTMYLWDDPTQPLAAFEWKSKVIRTQDYMNLGAARVIANFDNGSGVAAANTLILQANNTLISNFQVGGALAGNGNRAVPSPTGSQNNIGASLAGVRLAGSRLQPLLTSSATLNFYLYVNGTLALTAPVVNDIPFRLPTGYRVDKFEVRVTGNAPVKSIQLAETMQGLKAT